jgi:hypothetical protein
VEALLYEATRTVKAGALLENEKEGVRLARVSGRLGFTNAVGPTEEST